MKGLYILVILVAALVVLGYLVVKPTDSDLRRKYDRLLLGMETLETDLAGLQDPLVFLRSQKRTFKLDKENEVLRKRASQLRMQLNVALHNVENLSDATRNATEEVLTDLEADLNKQLSTATFFGRKVHVLHDFVKQGFPLRNQVELLQRRMNAAMEKKGSLTKDLLADLESYNLQCEQVLKWSLQAMTTLHTDLEQGEVLTQTAVNEMKKLLPNLEAFVEGLEKVH